MHRDASVPVKDDRARGEGVAVGRRVETSAGTKNRCTWSGLHARRRSVIIKRRARRCGISSSPESMRACMRAHTYVVARYPTGEDRGIIRCRRQCVPAEAPRVVSRHVDV